MEKIPAIDVYNLIGGVYQEVAFIDTYISLIIVDNYQTCNSFTLNLPLSSAHLSILAPDSVLKMNGCNYFIHSVDVADDNSKQMTVTGFSLAGKYYDRIIDQVYTATKRAELIAYDHFMQEMISPSNNNRKYSYIGIAAPPTLTSANISYQNSYDSVQHAVDNLCTTYGFGFREVDASSSSLLNQIQFYKGVDRSADVIISKNKEWETAVKEAYENNTVDFKSTARVFGEGEGSARKNVIVGDNLIGIDRREIYVDARDLQQSSQDASGATVTMPDADYLAALTARGNDKLSQQQRILSIKSDLNIYSSLYTIDVDFGLGDTVQVVSDLFQLSAKFPIISLKRTWDATGAYIETTFGVETPTPYQILMRK